MKTISKLALGVALALGVTGGAMTASEPAFAQKEKKEKAPKAPKLTKAVQAALAESQKLQEAGDLAGALAKVREAEAVANRTPDDNYTIAGFKYNLGAKQNDMKLVEQATAEMLASGKMAPEDQPKALRNMIAFAMQRNDFAAAQTYAQQLVTAAPNDSEAIATLAEVYQRAKQPQQAIATLRKAIDAKKAAGQPVPESWYKAMVSTAYNNKLAAELTPATMAWVAAYPTPTNWRDALLIFRDNARFDDQGNLDVLRLMRTVGALNGEADYGEYAETAAARGLPGEAKAVLDEGVSKGMLQASKPFVKELRAQVDPKVAADRNALASLEKEAQRAANGKSAMATGDGFLSHGNYAKAAEMYQLALQKGGVDADTANTRLGIALAKAGGRKAEADAAFAKVQTGNRAQLARYWQLWLSQQPA